MSHLRSKQAIHKTWTLSESGKKYAFYGANVATTSVLLGHILPNTFLIDYYKDFVRLYNKGFTVPVPENIGKRFERTLELLKIDQKDKYLYQPFMTCGFDTVSVGTQGRFGIHVGIPVNFGYVSVDTIDKTRIKVNLQTVVWDTDEGQQLLKALVIPENGQIYAMATEIKLRQSWKLFFDSIYASAACTFTYVGSAAINKRFNLYSQTRGVRLFSYGLVSLFNLITYFMCKDLTQNLYEQRIDKELKVLSPVFAEGGRQFYSQILERNKALRVLMGKEGESAFTVLGNENSVLRTKHRPIVQRKAFFAEENQPEQTGLIG